jgi:hypothetical protein
VSLSFWLAAAWPTPSLQSGAGEITDSKALEAPRAPAVMPRRLLRRTGVDIVLTRLVHEGAFRFEKTTEEGSFKNVRPGRELN